MAIVRARVMVGWLYATTARTIIIVIAGMMKTNRNLIWLVECRNYGNGSTSDDPTNDAHGRRCNT